MLQVRCAHPTGTGEPGQPFGRCAPAPPFAPKRPFGTFRCCAWLIFRFRTDPPSVRRCSARLIRQAETLELQPLRGLHQATPCSLIQNAHASGSLREPYGYRGARATPQSAAADSSPYTGEPGKPLRRCAPAPPFAPTQLFELRRCCAWLIKIREHTVLSYLKRTCFRFAARTLRVQGSRRQPPSPLRRTAPPFAPTQLFELRRCCAWLILRFRTDPPSVRRSSARLIRQAETLELQPLRGLHQAILCSFLQNAHASGSLREPYGYRGAEGQPLRRCAPAPPFAPKRPFGTFRCCAWLFFRKEHTMLFSPKRSCFRFAALTLRVSSHRPSSLSCAGVAHGLFYDSAPTHLRCAGVPLGLFGKPKRSSFSRFAASIKPYYALFSKTHMLQVRCANPTGTGEPRQPFGRRC